MTGVQTCALPISGIVPAALFAIILNIILPKDEKTEVEMAEEILAEKKEMESK